MQCKKLLGTTDWRPDLVWLIGAVVCLLAAWTLRSKCLLMQAMDGRIVRCGVISLFRSADTSEIVKRFWSWVLTRVKRIAGIARLFTYRCCWKVACRFNLLWQKFNHAVCVWTKWWLVVNVRVCIAANIGVSSYTLISGLLNSCQQVTCVYMCTV